MNFPTLYKKTSTGAIQFWQIEAIPQHASCGDASIIVTTYGQLGTDSPQVTQDLIGDGKNLGKKNATTAIEQADLEAKAKWEKQLKKGYVETKEAAEAEEINDIIEGGILPMLAQHYMDVVFDKRAGHENDPPKFVKTKHAKKIKFPANAQPKLDGVRCIAILKDGKCTLWSRTRKQINSMPHIQAELERLFPNITTTFDGELYNHEIRKESRETLVALKEGDLAVSPGQLNFEKIISLVRQDEPGEGHETVQYHIYDLPTHGEKFFVRSATLNVMPELIGFNFVKIVPTHFVKDEESALTLFHTCVKQGYEGLMLRNQGGEYVNKRSYDLQKIKPFDEDEFPILGVKEGRGKLAGHAVFTCRAKNGNPFDVKEDGDTSKLKAYFENSSLWQNKLLTVQYQGLTGAKAVPRFPVGKAIRDYE